MVLQAAARTTPPRTVPVGEALKILHVHPSTLRKWSALGQIPSYLIGRRRDRRFSLADLVAYLERDGNGTDPTTNGRPAW